MKKQAGAAAKHPTRDILTLDVIPYIDYRQVKEKMKMELSKEWSRGRDKLKEGKSSLRHGEKLG